MVFNKISDKTIKPLVYSTSKEKEQIASSEEVNLSESELKSIRQAVLEEIKDKSELKKKESQQIAKKIFKKAFLFKSAKNPTVPKLGVILSIKKLIFLAIKTVIITLFFSFIIVTLGIYLAGWQGEITQIIAQYLPYPAVYINGSFVTLNDFLSDVAALESYLQRNHLQFNSEVVRGQIMKSLIEKKVIEQLAKKNNLTITQKEINEEVVALTLKKSSSAELDKLVDDLYGWDFQMYTWKVIIPLIYAKKVENYFNLQSGNSAIRQKMEDYYQQLLGEPTKFEEIASTVNEDQTKATRGDLGWLRLGELNPELEIIIINLKENEINQVTETATGYYIFKLKERVIDRESKQPYFHVSQIFMKKSSFQKYLDEEIKKARVITLIKI